MEAVRQLLKKRRLGRLELDSQGVDKEETRAVYVAE